MHSYRVCSFNLSLLDKTCILVHKITRVTGEWYEDQGYNFTDVIKKIYALYRIIKINETCDLWHSACLRSMPRTTMTLHISLLHTFLQMWCWSWYGVTHYSVCLKSMQRTIKMHVLTYMLSVLQRHSLIWRVDRRMNRHTNWWMVWKLERLWDPPRGITVFLFPWNK